jgi:hypothetical protein
MHMVRGTTLLLKVCHIHPICAHHDAKGSKGPLPQSMVVTSPLTILPTTMFV